MPATNLLVLHPRQAHNYNPSFMALQATRPIQRFVVQFWLFSCHWFSCLSKPVCRRSISHPVGVILKCFILTPIVVISILHFSSALNEMKELQRHFILPFDLVTISHFGQFLESGQAFTCHEYTNTWTTKVNHAKSSVSPPTTTQFLLLITSLAFFLLLYIAGVRVVFIHVFYKALLCGAPHPDTQLQYRDTAVHTQVLAPELHAEFYLDQVQVSF